MILPFVTAISRDVFETVPPVLKEAAYGVGATTFEVVGGIVIPYTRVGVIGGVMLGARPRARRDDGGDLRHRQRDQDFDLDTRAGQDDFGDDRQSVRRRRSRLSPSSLLALGFILFVITFIVLALARWMLRGLEVKAGR